MNTNFPCSEETLASLSPNNFNKLEDAIAEEVKKRDMIELRENAVRALRDFFQAGGCLMNCTNTYNSVPDIHFDGDRHYIYIR